MKLRNLCLLTLFCCLFTPVLGGAESFVIRGIPHVQQKPDFCGEACLEMVLKKLGTTWTQDDIFNISGTDPVKGRGCVTRELVQAANTLGFDVGSTWYSVRSSHWLEDTNKLFSAMNSDLEAGVPSIVCMRYDKSPHTTEHFRLVVGYDGDTDQVLYLEPAGSVAQYQRMKRADFLSLWPLKYQSDRWTVIRLRMKSLHRPKPPKRDRGFTNADYAQHIRQLKENLPGPDFTVVLRKPFVVVGDESPATVRRRAEGTVGWSVDQLKALYFPSEPNQILNVWLFKDRSSYLGYTRKLFGSTPSTPYGYYSPRDGALVMNIATGGGTLVHEIVHPFMESNFPRCPDWFNEGLASLYEQSAERRGRIVGLTNWRLKGLQNAIRGKRLQSFTELTTRSFYGDDDGTNYAMARYLCYYLQEKGKLLTFYRSFKQNAESDPTGYKTLEAILGDMKEFQKGWERYVMRLEF